MYSVQGQRRNKRNQQISQSESTLNSTVDCPSNATIDVFDQRQLIVRCMRVARERVSVLQDNEQDKV